MSATHNTPANINKRLICVDALRGFDMLWIIGGGDVIIALAKAHPNNFLNGLAEHFAHQWGRFHFYDIIMPLFMFIVGVVMPVAFKTRLDRGDSKKQIYAHVLRRVIRLYILGLIASGHLLTFDINKIHLWTDTLHAIAVGYLVSSVLLLELNLKWQIGITAFLLSLYWVVIAFIPVPGYPAGMFEPTINLPLYVDNRVLGHFQEGEGWTYILTNMTFVCSVMLGVFAGKILMSAQGEKKKAAQLALIGVGCLAAGKIWGIWFPIIHHLWTSTLVLYAGGWSFLLLALFYLVIDVWGYKKWAFPFVVIGMNAIAVYVATHLFHFTLIGSVFVGGLAQWLGPWNEFVQELAALIVIWLILYWMYRKKTFVKV
ncbi:MAG: acyltransferase family protein [Chitinophagales bacterium]